MFGVNAAFSQGQLCFWNRGKLQEREGSHISKSCTVLILIPSTLLLNLIVEVWHWKSWPHSYLICPSPLFYSGRIYQRQQKNFVFKVCRKILFLRIWTILFFKSSLILQKVCMQLKQSGILLSIQATILNQNIKNVFKFHAVYCPMILFVRLWLQS